MFRRYLLFGVLCACQYAPPRSTPAGDAGDDDAAIGDDAPIDAPRVFGPWSVPVEITELNSISSDDDPSLTDDLLEIYFGSTRNGLEDIFVAKRASVALPFGTPTLVTELNSAAVETTPRVSRDGLMIMFASLRVSVDFEIFASTRASRSAAWSTPVRVTELGGAAEDFSAFPSTDQLQVIFVSARDGSDDVWTSQRATTQSAWDPPAKLTDLATIASDVDPVRIDANTIYFSSDRDGNSDIYLATRAGGVFTIAPVPELNSSASERDIWVSSDQRTAVFASTRNGGDDDIYISTRSFE